MLRVASHLAAIVMALFLASCASEEFGLTDGLRYPGSSLPVPLLGKERGEFPAGGRARGGAIAGNQTDQTGTTSNLYYPGTDQLAAKSDWKPSYESSTDGKVTLNLVDATITEAAKAILDEALGVPYFVDPSVTGTVTIQTAEAVPTDTIVAIFEAALRSKNAALVEDHGFYKIVPLDQAASSGARITTNDGSTNGQSVGSQIQVVPLAHVSAVEMANILRPMAGQGTIMRADTERNLLVLSGNRAELSTMLSTIRVFDVDWMEGKSFGLFRVEFADPTDVVKELDAIFSNEVGGAGKGLVRFIPNRNLQSVLVVTSRREYLDKAAGWIKRVDHLGGSNDKQLYIYHIQNRPAAQLAQLLQKIYSSQTRQTAKVSVVSAPNGQGGGPSGAAGQSPGDSSQAGFGTRLSDGIGGNGGTSGTGGTASQAGGFNTSVTAADVAGTAADTSGAGGQADLTSGGGNGTGEVGQDLIDQAQQQGKEADVGIVADESNNSLLIMAKPHEYEKILGILQRVDLEPNQVLLEATILEVSLNDQLKMGLRWFFQSGKSSFTFSDLLTGAVTSAFPGFSYFINSTNVKLAINALAKITDVNVLSSPSLMVLDNHTATLQVGDEVPIATQQAVGTITQNAPIVNSISFRNTGVILAVTPRVSDSGRVILDIEQEVSNVVPTTSSGIDSPTIQQRKIRTTVSVLDGESLTLGGLIQERDTNDRTQVPLVGDVPVLGNLFKTKDDRINRTELLVIITPRVIRTPAQADAVTEEFREQLNLNLRPAHNGPPTRRENAVRTFVR